jgi:hypothetical protein
VSRPSEKELWIKITAFREKVSAGDWAVVELLKNIPQFEALGCWTYEERTAALEAAGNEIRPEHYKGGHPPQHAYEQVCKHAELFAFRWESPHFKMVMYLKFCFVKQSLFLVSIHVDEPEKVERGRS